MRKAFLLNWKFRRMLCNYGTHFHMSEITLMQISLYRNWPTGRPVSPSAEQLLILSTCSEILSSALAWYQETRSFDPRYQLWDLWSPFFEVGCPWGALLFPAVGYWMILGLACDTTEPSLYIWAETASAFACYFAHIGLKQHQPVLIILLLSVTTADTDSQGITVTNM